MSYRGRIIVVALLVLGACGGSSSSTSSSTTSSSSSTAAKGPPTATLTLVGDPDVAGALNDAAVSCANPGFDGNTISIGGNPTAVSQPAESLFLFVESTKVTVRVGSGSGTDFKIREFSGTGVSNFDAATGATIDATLSEVTPATSNKGTLGAVASIKGSVDCGNFSPGTANVKLTGTTADGAVDGVLEPALVTCTTNQQGNFVIVRGIVTIGSTKGLYFVTTQPDGTLQVFGSVKGATTQHQYAGPAGSGTPSTTGVKINGDVTDSASAANKIHIEGDATCAPK